MNKENLQKQVEDMKNKLAEMEAELNKKEDVFPKYGDSYWCIHADSDVVLSQWCDGYYANKTLKYGNVYQSEEEAIKARDIQLAKVRVTDRIKELNDGWTPDWSDGNESKYIVLSSDTNRLWVSNMFVTKFLPNNMYMKSRGIAEQILSEMEDDIKLILGE